MKNLIILILLGLTLSQCRISFPINLIPHAGELEVKKTPVYKLDLDVEPRKRWDDIAPVFAGPIKQFQTRVLDILPLSSTFYASLGLFAETTPLYHDYVEELKGIADKTDTDWKKLLFAQFIYDISSIIPHPQGFCSSIVAKNSKGVILHGRNMDFWPWKLFSKDTALIKVYRGGNLIAEFDQIIGSVFVLSGIKKGSFSVTVDTRKFFEGQGGGLPILIENIIVNKYMPSAFLTREILQQEDVTYESAIEQFLNTSVTAPIYYIVGGLTSASIIEKDPELYHAHREITPETEEWFLVQTNYDQNEDPGLDDRVTPATKRLNSIGQDNITIDNFYNDVMLQYPTLNLTSIYNTMMIPLTGYNSFSALYGTIDDFVPYDQKSSNLRKQENQSEINDDIFISDAYYRQILEETNLNYEQIMDLQNQYFELIEQVLSLDH